MVCNLQLFAGESAIRIATLSAVWDGGPHNLFVALSFNTHLESVSTASPFRTQFPRGSKSSASLIVVLGYQLNRIQMAPAPTLSDSDYGLAFVSLLLSA